MRKVVNGVRVEMTQEEIDALEASRAVDTKVELEKRRNSAKLSRWEFCLTLKKSGLLPRNEAVQAGKGEWPATFAAFVSSLKEDEADIAQMRWADAREVHYADPLLQALALHHTKGNQAAATALLDQLFEI